MKTAYIDIPLSLAHLSHQIGYYAQQREYIPLNPILILTFDNLKNREALKTLKDIADEFWSFRATKRFPKNANRKFLIGDSRTIEEIL